MLEMEMSVQLHFSPVFAEADIQLQQLSCSLQLMTINLFKVYFGAL